jgi:hypothetical protein
MRSTNISSTASRSATSRCLFFHRRRPLRAASSLGELAITRSGILFAIPFSSASQRLTSLPQTLRLKELPAMTRPPLYESAEATVRPSAPRLHLEMQAREVARETLESCPSQPVDAYRREPLLYREHRKVGRITVGNLMPFEWGRDARIRQWTYGVCRRSCPVLGALVVVLVVVEKYTAALLFPPLRACQSWHMPFHRAGKQAPHDAPR